MSARRFRPAVLGTSVFLVSVLAVSSIRGYIEPVVAGLDGAHHLMDGVFFRDLFADLPFERLADYPFLYHSQYPALGLLFWPPLFAVVEGVCFGLGGVSLRMGLAAVTLFGLLLVFSAYFGLRRSLGDLYALAAVTAIVTVPVIGRHFQVVMLEVPLLAMLFTSYWLYRRALEHPSLRRLTLLAVAVAAAIYTKQTAFVIVPAMAVDLLANHRPLLRDRRLWLGAALAVGLLLPLAVFTLTWGSANIGQSVGSGTQRIVDDYQGPARWAVESWVYYPRAAWAGLGWLPLALGGLGLGWALFVGEFRRRNLFWLSWVLAFYLAFSYFDNKSARFAVLLYPPLLVLGLRWLQRLRLPVARRLEPWLKGIVLAGLCGLGIWQAILQPLHGVEGVEPIVERLEVPSSDGGFAYFGDYRQVFVFFIRSHDPERSHWVLQGDDIMRGRVAVEEVLHDFRVRYLLVEPDSADGQRILPALRASDQIEQVGDAAFRSRRGLHRLLVLRYNGALSKRMHRVPLESDLVSPVPLLGELAAPDVGLRVPALLRDR